MPKGHYLENGSYFVGVMPDGEIRFYCEERDYKEDYAEALRELEAKT